MNNLLIQLNHFDHAKRLEALKTLAESNVSRGRSGHVNLHFHSFFSFNAEGWSPSLIAWESYIHGANSSVERDYIKARELLESGRIDGKKLVTHRFRLDDFRKAVETQKDPSSGCLKTIIIP